jgi:hypothetical protein
MKLKIVLPAAYCAIALAAWLDFARLPPDGLANVGLMLVVLPITLLDLALRPQDAAGTFVLMPDSLGYYAGHAVYFGGAVALISSLLTWAGATIDRRRSARRAAKRE